MPAIQEQMAAITETAERMEKMSGTSEAIFRSSFATLVSYGATKKEISLIGPAMADWLARTQGVSATMEDANDLAAKIAQAVDSRKLGRFVKELALTPEQIKQWKGLTSNFARLDFLSRAMEARSKGQAAAQVGSLGGQLLLAENEKTRILADYGNVFNKIRLKWELAGNAMMKVALPWAKPVVEEIGKDFDAISDTVKKVWSNLSAPGMKGFWDEWGKSVKEFQTTLKPLSDAIAKQFTATELTKSWKEFGQMLETDMEWIKSGVEWAQKLGKAFDDSADAVERFGKVLRGAI